MYIKKRRTHRFALSAVVLLLLGLTGCVTRQQPLYYWGDFQSHQYAYFKGEQGAEEAIVGLEKIREEAKASGKLTPPGLEAHLGMLYGLTGRTDLFEQNLQAERLRFPESAVFVDFLMKKKQIKGKQ